MIKVTIDRLTWLRGEGSTMSALLRKADQKMCCLGSAALALGQTSSQIEDIQIPSRIRPSDQTPEMKDFLVKGQEFFGLEAVFIN